VKGIADAADQVLHAGSVVAEPKTTPKHVKVKSGSKVKAELKKRVRGVLGT